MTGAEFRVMIFAKKKSIALLISGILFSGASKGEKLSIDVANFDINVITTLTCEPFINGQKAFEYNLGTLNPGQIKNHKSFDVAVRCDAPGISTYLTAKLKSGGNVESSGDAIVFTIGAGKEGAGRLKLFDITDKAILFDGKTSFCEGVAGDSDNERICSLRPQTIIDPNANGGNFNVGVSFEVTVQ